MTALETIVTLTATSTALLGAMGWWQWYRNPLVRRGSWYGSALTGVAVGAVVGFIGATMLALFKTGTAKVIALALAPYVLPVLFWIGLVVLSLFLIRSIWRLSLRS